MKYRIHKILAKSGYGSLRGIEKLIAAGKVTINGKIAEIGMQATMNDKICIDGKIAKLNSIMQTRVILYNKPTGQICTRDDPQQRETVFNNLPNLHTGRWISIGRLDINTQGLLLFTNNGQLAHKLMHPSFKLEREYAVRIYGKISEEILNNLRSGIMLADGLGKFSQLSKMGKEKTNSWFKVTVTQGRNRLVRRLWESQGLEVNRLIRIKFGNITLPHNLPQKKWIELDPESFCKLEDNNF